MHMKVIKRNLNRAAEKQLSREHDELRIAKGEIDREALRLENGLFASIDLSKGKILGLRRMRS
jgi:hypothetical protein